MNNGYVKKDCDVYTNCDNKYTNAYACYVLNVRCTLYKKHVNFELNAA